MTRRYLLAALVVPLIAQPDTPRNRLCMAANEFQGVYVQWAAEMNRDVNTVNAAAIRQWEPLPEMWRKVERLWRAWLRG
jgi:hypothetical protein